MKDLKDTCRVAVVQCAPVMFDKKAGTEKMVERIREASVEELKETESMNERAAEAVYAFFHKKPETDPEAK